MNLPLVVGVDGSEASLRAVDWAADEAALRRAPLRIVYASLWERYEGPALAREIGSSSGRVAAEDILAAAALRALRHHAELHVTTDDVLEEPEHALVRESRDASALVVGTRGRSGLADLLLGSVSLTVAAQADCPVVVIRGNHGNRAVGRGQDHIVVGVADAPTAAVRFAYAEAKRRDVALEAVRAWRCPMHETVDHPLLTGDPERVYEERAARELEQALADAPVEVRLRRRTVEGPARRVLLAASRDAGLLIVGRRRPGRLGPHLGRVAHTVLHHSGCPVVVVPERE
ncbi:universal stress protein [Streptomyces sp. CB00316]|uniref:universal stress protein n=1 Tax=unclassified Streptomyces TaxID=2593676 RepID=UPI00093F958E|nr:MULTISPECIES: universal stress protein [unclassified Streptomyces]MBT2381361.1 universal stress protein [Streptomyces sp. ISL-111]MBT2430216.1 universal stress protein [Streptomyces sp. ISL-112]MBT2462852.1 universal stress protein [Streptomyces sp. ISL-63]OKJ21735.1 universal stress protein [Streptomyces sp. CB00316]